MQVFLKTKKPHLSKWG